MKPAAEDDPMEFVAVGLPGGDPDRMAECVIEEFLLMGWSDRQLMTLFKHPRFRATHQIYLDRGEDHVRALIARVGAAWRPVGRNSVGGAENA
ncbi:MAG: hypothetical protein BroJett024_40020 [Alphaproteobacteria bacterium]|nr:MAG: hypothetical protein BroJett024_40020 [Alphaproteobacteria bacterium]